MTNFFKNNRFQIIVVLLILILVIIFWLYMTDQKNKYSNELAWANEPDQYMVFTYQIGGVGIRQSQSSVTYVTEHGYLKPVEKYSSVSFNSPADLMQVYCGNGYVITSCTSDDSKITFDSYNNISTCSLSIEEKVKSSVQYVCTKQSISPPTEYFSN